MTHRLETSPAADRSFPPGGATIRRFLLLFLALAALVSATSFATLFRMPANEEGDDAANALQIHRAKQFAELHGNYSRWGFHHPGPAFFYCYALGEAVLHDATALVPRPRNAHVYTGVLVQLAFYAAAVALLGRYARRPLLTMALALLLGAWHFAHVERILFSIWPPDVLLMPFLCFALACAGVMIGDLLAVPVAIVAGSFLVHGHVAQPLFVLPIFGLAAVAGLRRPGTPWREQTRQPAVRAGLVLLGVFLLPIVIDLASLRYSNAYDVWLHLKYQRDEGQTLWQSVLCYASAFVGLNDPTMFNTLDASSYQPFRERAWLLALWAAAAAGIVTWLMRCGGSGLAPRFLRAAQRGAHPLPPLSCRFGAALLAVLLLAGALTVVWGMRQDGGFTNFNSHFNHTLVHAHALLAVLALTSLLPRGSRLIASTLLASAVLVFALRLPYRPETYSRGDELAVHVRGLLRADPKPAAPKLLVFDTEPGVPHWYEAVALARQFQQAGIPFHVSPDWRVMFGAGAVLPDDPELLARVSVWKLLRRRPAATGDDGGADGARHRLNRECDVVFPTAPVVSELPIHIDFRRVTSSPLLFYGFGGSEGEFAWTNAKMAQLKFHAPDRAAPVRLAFEAAGLVPTRSLQTQRVRITVNGVEVARGTFGAEVTRFACDIPPAVWNARQPRLIAFEMPDAIAPARIGRSADRRILGLRVHTLSLTPAP